MTIKDTPLGIDTSILGFIASVTWDQGATLSTGELAEMSSSLDIANCEKDAYTKYIAKGVHFERFFKTMFAGFLFHRVPYHYYCPAVSIF